MVQAETRTRQAAGPRGAAEPGTYDVVVIGGGAGGLNAALVLGRARRRVAVVDAGEPRNAPAAHMQGFLSRDGMSPAELLAVGRAEVAGYGVDLIQARVDGIEAVGTDAVGTDEAVGAEAVGGNAGTPGSPVAFHVTLSGGPVLRARRMVVATGLRDVLPDIPGLRERWGRDVLHCPYCHGYEVRDRPLGVLGTHPGAADHALLLRQWSSDVVLFRHTADLRPEQAERLAARGVRVIEGTVKRVVADPAADALTGVELADGRVVARDAVFVLPHMVPHDALLTGLGCAVDENGWVAVDPAGRTSVPGVWAVGNVRDPRAQVVTAAGMGASAAFALNLDLVEEDVATAVARSAASSAPLPPFSPAGVH
ncbi:NAD(P)/FAD-dependent oxidoreductase [Yinghuangia sp. YIM S09857]|uniref:NAD(P)/FAD-dependent oxidoreductase n=1 Tax=Yinghuangia sp. YIM S09857 TaxID=3436929 RepID=UPI003F537E7F